MWPSRRLADSEQRYRLLAENSSDVVLLTDAHLNLHWVSPAARAAFGHDPEQMIGRTAADFIHPDDLPVVRGTIERSVLEGQTLRIRYRWRCADGGYQWVESLGRPVVDEATGQVGRVVGLRVIDAQVQAEQDLAAREERYRLLAENASDVVWQVAPDGRLSWVSPSITRILGWSPADVVGRVAMELIHAEDRDRAIAGRTEVLAGESVQGEFRVLCHDGSARAMALSVHPVPTPEGVTRIVALHDIEDEVEARHRLEFALGHDQMTGLARRDTMLHRIDHLLGQLGRFRLLAVLCVGIDALSEVNEAFTHSTGDIVVTTIAARLVAAADGPDLVGRASGDEFLVVLSDLGNGADAAAAAERLRLAAQGLVTVAGRRILPTISIGIATGGKGTAAEQLLRDASLALRKAKNGGRDRFEFADPGLAIEAQVRLSLEVDIRDALRDGEIVPWFQPIVAMADGRRVGYEALARWVRPSGVILPAVFIPIAERTSLITDLDISVMRQSVAALATLPPDTFVAINVTAATLSRTDYADQVLEMIEEFGVHPMRLHLEITETTLINLVGQVSDVTRRLAHAGVRWYVDDFGTGYSSISHLRDLPLAGIKLDRSFTRGIRSGEATSMQLADALAGLARGLKLDTVAEGVELQSEADYLGGHGWRHGQGWLFGRPEPLPLR